MIVIKNFGGKMRLQNVVAVFLILIPFVVFVFKFPETLPFFMGLFCFGLGASLLDFTKESK